MTRRPITFAEIDAYVRSEVAKILDRPPGSVVGAELLRGANPRLIGCRDIDGVPTGRMMLIHATAKYAIIYDYENDDFGTAIIGDDGNIEDWDGIGTLVEALIVYCNPDHRKFWFGS